MHARLVVDAQALGPTLAADARTRWADLGVRLAAVRMALQRGDGSV
jgi:hypothetical protein